MMRVLEIFYEKKVLEIIYHIYIYTEQILTFAVKNLIILFAVESDLLNETVP